MCGQQKKVNRCNVRFFIASLMAKAIQLNRSSDKKASRCQVVAGEVLASSVHMITVLL